MSGPGRADLPSPLPPPPPMVEEVVRGERIGRRRPIPPSLSLSCSHPLSLLCIHPPHKGFSWIFRLGRADRPSPSSPPPLPRVEVAERDRSTGGGRSPLLLSLLPLLSLSRSFIQGENAYRRGSTPAAARLRRRRLRRGGGR